MKVFLVPGYGIPENIETDKNYQTYLSIVFNRIYAMAADRPCVIMPCGGPTSTFPPFDVTESSLLFAYFRNLMSRGATVKGTQEWRFVLEDASLSTLDNFVFASELLRQISGVTRVHVFSEATRVLHVRTLVKKLFDESWRSRVEAIDFDTSPIRYRSASHIRLKAKAEAETSLWALSDPDNLRRQRELLRRKFDLIRDLVRKGASHDEAIAAWYKNAPTWMAELMPDHPMIREINKHKTP